MDSTALHQRPRRIAMVSISIRSCRTERLGSDTIHGAAQLVDLY
uniref:Uncharacterized protein n=1 Tax=Arundo donax TaxID=35708 RepID=A0A0A9HDU2_ARUDO